MGTQSIGTDLVAEEKFSHLSSPLHGPVSHFAESSRLVVQADPSSTPKDQERSRDSGASGWQGQLGPHAAFYYTGSRRSVFYWALGCCPLLKVLFSQLCQSTSTLSEVQLHQMSSLTSSRACQQMSAGAPLGCSCLPSQLHLHSN